MSPWLAADYSRSGVAGKDTPAGRFSCKRARSATDSGAVTAWRRRKEPSLDRGVAFVKRAGRSSRPEAGSKRKGQPCSGWTGVSVDDGLFPAGILDPLLRIALASSSSSGSSFGIAAAFIGL